MKETKEQKKEGLPVIVPVSIIRWLFYSAGFVLLLLPFSTNTRELACGGLILGHFASQLNALINKK